MHSQKGIDHACQAEFAKQGLYCLRPAVHLAPQMGAHVVGGQILLHALPFAALAANAATALQQLGFRSLSRTYTIAV